MHGNDFLESPEYTDYIAGLIGSSGYPNSVVNRDRNTAGDPEYIPVRFEQKASAPIEGYVTLETGGEDGLYEATAKVALNSNGLDGRYRMAYAIVENDVYEGATPTTYSITAMPEARTARWADMRTCPNT